MEQRDGPAGLARMTSPDADRHTHEQGVDDADTPLAEQSTIQINRARMQGGGVGARELNGQRDPTGEVAAGDTAAPQD